MMRSCANSRHMHYHQQINVFQLILRKHRNNQYAYIATEQSNHDEQLYLDLKTALSWLWKKNSQQDFKK